jgi:RNA polymerase sigma factor (sigma-70 family)
MPQPPLTRPSLLARIRDRSDQQAWQQFVDLYAPLIYGQARKLGLQDADAADVTQEVFRSVTSAAGKLEYDPQRGTFRGWLYAVTRSKINDFLERRQRTSAGSGDTAVQQLLEEQPARGDDDQRWERDYQERVFAWAAEQVRSQIEPATWQAFWLVAVEGKSGQEAAATLGMNLASVYAAKSRVLTRLKKQIQEMEDET